MKWLEGNKTYICAALIAAVTFAHAMGWIDDASRDTLIGVVGAGGLAALRAGVAKV